MRKSLISIFLLSAVLWLQAQEQPTLAERLGYEKDDILLIIHADDLGLAQSVNSASVAAFTNGGITSGSLMVPCPWTGDFARRYREDPSMDVGIHLTLNAEWEYYRWDGISPATEIQTLLDGSGYLHQSVEAVARHAHPGEVEKEARAQIERALELGIDPTHLDTHMGSIGARPELFGVYLKLGREYGLPLLLPRFWIMQLPEVQREALAGEFVVLDGLFMLNADPGPSGWADAYEAMLDQMKPGLNQLIVHLSHDDAEMQAISINHPDFGAAWRQHDLDFVSGEAFRQMISERGIRLVTWKQIRDLPGLP